MVPTGHYYLLGDNRANSRDSRSFGPIPAASLVGVAEFVWLSAGPDGVRWSRVGVELRGPRG